MKDDIGNQFEIDFADNHFRMENADGSYVDMTHDHIEAKNQTGSNVDIEGDKIFARIAVVLKYLLKAITFVHRTLQEALWIYRVVM
jgi:hypothetical protein